MMMKSYRALLALCLVFLLSLALPAPGFSVMADALEETSAQQEIPASEEESGEQAEEAEEGKRPEAKPVGEEELPETGPVGEEDTLTEVRSLEEELPHAVIPATYLRAADLIRGQNFELDKTAQAVDGKLNTYEVELTVTSKTAPPTLDVVLVLDATMSMADHEPGDPLTKFEHAKEAAKAFVQTLLPASGNTGTRVGIVSFNLASAVLSNLSSDRDQLLATLDALDASSLNWRTNVQRGFHETLALINGSGAQEKHVVLLSDGLSNACVKMFDPAMYATVDVDGKTCISTDLPASAFDYSDPVSISYPPGHWSLYVHIAGTDNPKKFYYPIHAAIAEGKILTQAGATLHMVKMPCIGDTPGDSEWLESHAGKMQQAINGQYIPVTSTSQLSAVFTQIANTLSPKVKVNDPLGVGWSLPADAISGTPSHGSVSYDAATRTILWEIPPLKLDEKASLKYIVEANQDMLLIPGFESNALCNTNNQAVATFIDNQGASQSLPFPEPQGKPTLVEFRKLLLDADGHPITDDKTKAVVEMGGRSYEVSAGGSLAMVDLRDDIAYDIIETAMKGDNVLPLDQYLTTVQWESWDHSLKGELVVGKKLSGIRIPRDAANLPQNIRITFTNQLPKPTPSEESSTTPAPTPSEEASTTPAPTPSEEASTTPTPAPSEEASTVPVPLPPPRPIPTVTEYIPVPRTATPTEIVAPPLSEAAKLPKTGESARSLPYALLILTLGAAVLLIARRR